MSNVKVSVLGYYFSPNCRAPYLLSACNFPVLPSDAPKTYEGLKVGLLSHPAHFQFLKRSIL